MCVCKKMIPSVLPPRTHVNTHTPQQARTCCKLERLCARVFTHTFFGKACFVLLGTDEHELLG